MPIIITTTTLYYYVLNIHSVFDKLWIVDILNVEYLAALHARGSIIVLNVVVVAKRDELDLS